MILLSVQVGLAIFEKIQFRHNQIIVSLLFIIQSLGYSSFDTAGAATASPDPARGDAKFFMFKPLCGLCLSKMDARIVYYRKTYSVHGEDIYIKIMSLFLISLFFSPGIEE